MDMVLPAMGVTTTYILGNETQPAPASVVIGPLQEEVGEVVELFYKLRNVGVKVTLR